MGPFSTRQHAVASHQRGIIAHRNRDRYLRDAPPQVKGMLETMIPNVYGENERLRRDEDCRSVGLAAMNLMLAATELGYGSCPMIGFDPEKVSEVLGLPADHAPLRRLRSPP